jgi:hypothetical protein
MLIIKLNIWDCHEQESEFVKMSKIGDLLQVPDPIIITHF